ncbi:hypothetical protein RI367_001638 [Sorochytrium milnesiophthora]
MSAAVVTKGPQASGSAPAGQQQPLLSFTKSRDWPLKLIEELADMVYVLSGKANIVYVAPSCKDHAGFLPSELAGHHLGEFVHPDDVRTTTRAMQSTVNTGVPYHIYIRFRRKNADYILLEVTGRLLQRPQSRGGSNELLIVNVGREYPTRLSVVVNSVVDLRVENEVMRNMLQPSNPTDKRDEPADDRQSTSLQPQPPAPAQNAPTVIAVPGGVMAVEESVPPAQSDQVHLDSDFCSPPVSAPIPHPQQQTPAVQLVTSALASAAPSAYLPPSTYRQDEDDLGDSTFFAGFGQTQPPSSADLNELRNALLFQPSALLDVSSSRLRSANMDSIGVPSALADATLPVRASIGYGTSLLPNIDPAFTAVPGVQYPGSTAAALSDFDRSLSDMQAHLNAGFGDLASPVDVTPSATYAGTEQPLDRRGSMFDTSTPATLATAPLSTGPTKTLSPVKPSVSVAHKGAASFPGSNSDLVSPKVPASAVSSTSKALDDASAGAKRPRKRRSKPEPEEHVCMDCGTTQSPEWRKGPTGAKTLCNACGLRFAKRRKQEMAAQQGDADEVNTGSNETLASGSVE